MSGWAKQTDLIPEIVHRIVDGFDPDKIILFGSYAWDKTDQDSDLDLLVIMDYSGSKSSVAVNVRRALIGVPAAIDVLVASPAEIERLKDDPGYIYRPALREGKVIYPDSGEL